LIITLVGAIAIAQGRETLSDLPGIRTLNDLFQNFLEKRQGGRAAGIVAKIAESEPKVFVDGQPAPPLELGPSATINVEIPGEGVFSVTLYPVADRTDMHASEWAEAGHIRGNVIEFQAGSKQVRIECNARIIERDRPVFARRLP
jgi:hypothetical protein